MFLNDSASAPTPQQIASEGASRRKAFVTWNSILLVITFGAGALHAVDKNGVSPQAIALPSGPGSIQGLGESYQPQLNSGSGSYDVPLTLPKGSGGFTPELSFTYNSGASNGPLGLGWTLAGAHKVCRNTDSGIPLYVDAPDGEDNDRDGRVDNPEELDGFTGLDGEELVALADGSFRPESEGSFVRYERLGGGWTARTKDGSRFEFGVRSDSRVEHDGQVFAWWVEKQVDKNGNSIEYDYVRDPVTPAQVYIRRIRWGGPEASFAVVFHYEGGRPDAFVSFRSGFEVRTSLRLARLDIVSNGLPTSLGAVQEDVDGDGVRDTLVRRYEMSYDATAHLSLLTRVTQFGNDGITTLPSLVLDYNRWDAPDNVVAATIRSRGAPTQGFASDSVELIDMNGDGLPDLLDTTASRHRVFLNQGVQVDGRLQFGPSVPVGNAPDIDISSTQTHLADATADGLSDLVVKVTPTRFFCFDNSSDNSWLTPSAPLTSTDSFPIWPFDGEGGQSSRSIDCDYSRSNDVLFTSASGYRLWMLLPGGQYSRELRLPPLLCDGKVFDFSTPGTRIADINGDRLQDLVWLQATRIVYFPNHGRGRFGDPLVLSLGRSLSADEIAKAGFSDVDGDGLVDLTIARPTFATTSLVYWLNRFDDGFEGPRSVRGLPAEQSGDALRFADMNGNGSTDLVISQARSAVGESILVVELLPEQKPYLLSRAENGLGLDMTFEYESSVAQMVRAEAEGIPWSRRMPMGVQVVSRIREDDGLGNVYDRVVTYRDPFYDAQKQEFRGFERAELRELGDGSAATRVERKEFDTGRTADCLKGKTLVEETAGDDGTLFSRTENRWSHRVLATGIDGRSVCFATRDSSETLIVEGSETPVRTRLESSYDDFGNVIAERNLGVVDRLGDELFVEREIDLRVDRWLLDLVRREVTTDASDDVVSERRFVHDALGNLKRQEAWLDTDDRFVPELRQEFDAFGNVTEITDAKGHRRTVEYDRLLAAYPVLETIHLEERTLAMSADYELAFGVVRQATDYYGQRTTYEYDALGRLLLSRAPGGAGERYEYNLSNPVSQIIKRVAEDASGSTTFDSFSYFDGYGRPLGTKVEAAENGFRFVEAVSYNARKSVSARWLPHFVETAAYEPPSLTEGHSTLRYDPLGRTVETTQPDGAVSRAVYLPLKEVAFDENDTAGLGKPTTTEYDGLGRVARVEEQNGDETYVTQYHWSALNQLVEIVDALGNVKAFGYDSLRRLTQVRDPNSGRRAYAYDDVGNMTRSEDAKGQVITFRYDSANRLVEENYLDQGGGPGDRVDVRYHYDDAAGSIDFGDGTAGRARNVQGRLAWVDDPSGEEHFSYDARGNTEWAVKRVYDTRLDLHVSYRTQYGFDVLNRPVGVIYPDNDRVVVTYDGASHATRVDGGPSGRAIFRVTERAATGRRLQGVCGNGVATTHTYDSRERLSSIRAVGPAGVELIHQRIDYDPISNVTSITDERPFETVPVSSGRRATVVYRYDDLHRLVLARYGLRDDPTLNRGEVSFSYDALGNILERLTPPSGEAGHIADSETFFGTFGFQGGRSQRAERSATDPAGPHAATTLPGGRTLRYDANGCVVRNGDRRLEWDFVNRLVEHVVEGESARYSYDYSDRRVAKATTRGRVDESTVYVNRHYEERSGVPVKYVFHEDHRIAKVTGMMDPSRDRVQRLRLPAGWTLVSSAVEDVRRLEEVFGSDSVVYAERSGELQELPSSTVVPFATALWVFAPTARVATLRGPYPTEFTPVATSGQFHAWPRLREFVPAVNVAAPGRMQFLNTSGGEWLLSDSSLPGFLRDLPGGYGGAGAFYSRDAVSMMPNATRDSDFVFYHSDHLGSCSVVTDSVGALIEEVAYYPYGTPRESFRPNDGPAALDYSFTDKERDSESGLVAMGARYYLDGMGAFASPDPRYTEAPRLAAGSKEDQDAFQSFLKDPQLANVYAYALRNPLKNVDENGFDPKLSREFRKMKAFDRAWKAFVKTARGGQLVDRYGRHGRTLHIRAAYDGKRDRTTGRYGDDGGVVQTVVEEARLKPGEAAILIDIEALVEDSQRRMEAAGDEGNLSTWITKSLGSALFWGMEDINAKTKYWNTRNLNRMRAENNESQVPMPSHPSVITPTGGILKFEHPGLEERHDRFRSEFRRNIGLTD